MSHYIFQTLQRRCTSYGPMVIRNVNFRSTNLRKYSDPIICRIYLSRHSNNTSTRLQEISNVTYGSKLRPFSINSLKFDGKFQKQTLVLPILN
jgi:hypothetical protein